MYLIRQSGNSLKWNVDHNAKKVLTRISLAAVVLTMSTTLFAAEITIKEFRGTGNTTTASFRVDSPWLLDWRLDGDYKQLIALDITLVDARTGRHVGRILHTKRRGNGLKLFHEAGEFQLRVSSSLARWTLKVQQIEPEEAERYTPRGQD